MDLKSPKGPKPGELELAELIDHAIGLTLLLASGEALAVGTLSGLDPRALLDAINISSGVNQWTRDVLSAGSHEIGISVDQGRSQLNEYLAHAGRVGMPPGIIHAARDAWTSEYKDALGFRGISGRGDARAKARQEDVAAGERKDDSVIDAPTGSKKIGFIGLGNMGGAIVRRLLRNGIEVVGFDRNEHTVHALADEGMIVAESAHDVAERTDLVLVCVPDASASRKVADEVARGSAVKTYGELSTIGEQAAADLARALAQSGIAFVDMPVSGGISAAEKGSLALLLAGRDAAADKAAGIGSHIGRVVRLGQVPGQGQLCKIVNNALNFTALIASMEAIAVGVALGLNGRILTEKVASGLGSSSATLEKFPRAILSRTLRIGGAAKGVLKDLDLYLGKARQVGVRTDVIAAGRDLWHRAIEVTGTEQDGATVVRYFEGFGGKEIRG